ncbi:MAG: DUF3800 domain-containing protein [Cyclobacteriaceae bacterium]|nr:DUF3800 domain-containing protein [Cyclobacteriaceae bacterium]
MSRLASRSGGIPSNSSRFFFTMYLCYIDESGTPDVPGATSHYVLAALSIPIYKWKVCENEINQVKKKYNLVDAEIHTGWLIRNYIEQNKISAFESMTYEQRQAEVEKFRRAELLRLQKSPSHRKQLKQTKKNYAQTSNYVHLTLAERKNFVLEVAKTIGNWGFARLFAECIDKVHFDPSKAPKPVDEQAFEQIVSRVERYLDLADNESKSYGLLIHDNNETVAKRHTALMKQFHVRGTFWTDIKNIIETPLFVDSSLTSMIQIVDVCAYAIRRYLENSETELFDEVFKRADRRRSKVVGVRHFTSPECRCKICSAHK